jgi:preprotein translocase subunit SecA
MAKFWQKLLGSKADRDLKALTPTVSKVHKASEQISKLSNDELRAKTIEFKNRINENIQAEQKEIAEIKEKVNSGENIDIQEKEKLYERIDELEKNSYDKTQDLLNDIMPEAFAVVKETAKRFTENDEIEVDANDFDKQLATKRANIQIDGSKANFKTSWDAGGNEINWEMIHYDVQLIGGNVLHSGKIAEMATGEGKTLVATLPVYLNALPGKGVHVVTVNDYLAKRDSEWMGMIFEFHGLSVDCIDRHQPNSQDRRNAYLADITYGTNNEFGFDYLRDNMTAFPDELVQRPHNYAIVDEVDSVLIDDARTPLIISGPTPQGDKQEFDNYKMDVQKLYNHQKTFVTGILAESKKLLAEENNQEDKKKGAELLFRAYRGLPKNKALIKFLSEAGMKTLLQKTEGFYMQENSKNMHIIDDELFFVIDEKSNSIDLTDKGVDLLSRNVDDQDFFVLPDVGSKVADLEKSITDPTELLNRKNEVLQDYSIKSERVHTVHQLLKAYALFEKDVEYVLMDNKIKIVDEQTGRIMEGRRYSDGLHQAIEAKENVKVEAATQTYATITLQNYFRMYKKLSGMTGTAETEAGEFWDIYELDVVVIPTNKPIARDDQSDMVYRTKREKYNAVIDEVERLQSQGRPVLVGTTSVETSELLSRMLTRKKIQHNVLNAKLHQKEADIVAEAGREAMVTIATNMAGRGTDIKLSKQVKDAGGLAIIGTERHESRRVDRQLRGRAGRQGDPGSSVFFVSLEDDLMRMFGSERIARIMDMMKLPEGEVIQHNSITKSIERAQKKVEENNFGTRKHLLEYDDVMNSQREVIYKKRKHALFGERLAVDISNMIYDHCESLITEYQDSGDFEGFQMEVIRTMATESTFEEKQFLDGNITKLTDELFAVVYKNYESKSSFIADRAMPVIKDVYENHSNYENIAIPITDGQKEMQVVTNLQKAYENEGKEVALSIEKNITLRTIDNAWKEHLRELDDLKQAVRTATYEQKDPLLIYKFESFELFKSMISKVNKDIVSFLVRANLPNQTKAQEAQDPRAGRGRQKLQELRSDMLSDAHSNTGQKEKSKPQPVKVEKKVGRNEPCPCGSGKKYKNCHGKVSNVPQ